MSFRLSFNSIRQDFNFLVWAKSVFVSVLDLGLGILYITVCLWPLSSIGSLYGALCVQVVSRANQKVRGHGKSLDLKKKKLGLIQIGWKPTFFWISSKQKPPQSVAWLAGADILVVPLLTASASAPSSCRRLPKSPRWDRPAGMSESISPRVGVRSTCAAAATCQTASASVKIYQLDHCLYYQ